MNVMSSFFILDPTTLFVPQHATIFSGIHVFGS